MIEVDADATRSRRRTWVTGGALFIASALLGLAPPELPFGATRGVSTVLFVAGAMIFAIGLGRAGSVTARRPLGTGAVIGLAVWQLLVGPLFGVIALGLYLATGTDPLQTGSMLPLALEVVTLALALVASVQIARTRVVPQPWNRAPLWALLAIAATHVIVNVAASANLIDDQEALWVLFSLIGLISSAALTFLGVLAIVLAVRPAPVDTVVYQGV